MAGFVAQPFPERSGTREQQIWMRAVEDRIIAIERDRYRESQDANNDNKGLSGSLERLAAQVAAVQQAQLDANTALGQANAAIASVTSTVNFLVGQTQYGFAYGTFNDISTANSWGFNAAYDAQVVIQAGSTGKLMIQVVAGCQGSGMTKGPIVGMEAIWSGGSRAFTNDPTYEATAWRYTATATRLYELNVPAFSVVTVRVRRGASNTTNEQILVQGTSLAVTKVGQ